MIWTVVSFKQALGFRKFICVPLAIAFSFAPISSILSLPAYGANEETIQLQTQIDLLQQQMIQMKRLLDENTGLMQHLLEQNTHAIRQQADRAAQVDRMYGQIQALNDTLHELSLNLAKLSKKVEDTQAAQRSIARQQFQAQQDQMQVEASPSDVRCKNPLHDYDDGNNDLAAQEFSDYIKFYRNTELAEIAYFCLAGIDYKAGDFENAIANYDLLLQEFPNRDNSAAARLKKGFALLELGKDDDGIAELRQVIQRYPRTNEASLALGKLDEYIRDKSYGW